MLRPASLTSFSRNPVASSCRAKPQISWCYLMMPEIPCNIGATPVLILFLVIAARRDLHTCAGDNAGARPCRVLNRTLGWWCRSSRADADRASCRAGDNIQGRRDPGCLLVGVAHPGPTGTGSPRAGLCMSTAAGCAGRNSSTRRRTRLFAGIRIRTGGIVRAATECLSG
jgi:hypothetical protein